jgi:hypothetical protein
MSAIALTQASDADLELLLRRVHRGELSCPFKRSDLLLLGMNALAERADLLFGLERDGVRAVLTAVLAERRRPSSQR